MNPILADLKSELKRKPAQPIPETDAEVRHALAAIDDRVQSAIAVWSWIVMGRPSLVFLAVSFLACIVTASPAAAYALLAWLLILLGGAVAWPIVIAIDAFRWLAEEKRYGNRSQE